MNQDKNISYLNKSFSDFKANLQNYIKTYFPNSYNDFSDANPGGIFIDLAAYVGDVTSFYLDTQVQENFLLYAKQKENLYAEAYSRGYRPKVSYASFTKVDIYQLIPTTQSAGVTFPDMAYSLIIPENTVLTSNSTGTKFLTTNQVDFSDTSSAEITYVDTNFYLLKKTTDAISAEIKSTTFTFGAPQKFSTTNISDTNILQILDITGSDGNRWYEVPYLAQSTIFTKANNSTSGSDGVPYLLQLQQVPRRFTTRFLSDDTLQVEFGAGVSTNTDTQIIPTPDNIQLGLVPGISDLQNNYNEASIFYTREYGLAPSNISMQVRYLVGGGINSNVPSNDLTTIDTTNVTYKYGDPGGALSTQVLQSILSTNPSASVGGRNGDEIEEIRNNTLYTYSSQLRAVTKEDYIVRALSMPSDYGNIAKVYMSQDTNSSLTLNMYVLAFNSNNKLTQASSTLKQNLVSYINQYRMLTDAINIKDAFYINIGINFDITVLSGFNNKDVLTACILALQEHFNISKWQINQPIVISDIYTKLLQIRGVKSVVKVEIVNKQSNDGTYSQYGYDIAGATRNGNIYPSLDPSIFELRYPNNDLLGRCLVN